MCRGTGARESACTVSNTFFSECGHVIRTSGQDVSI